jgi:hypothetical protein
MSTELPNPQTAETPAQAWAFKDEVYVAHAAPLPGYRPGALTAVCIIGMILGGLGLLAGMWGGAMALFGAQVQQWQAQMGTVGSPQAMVDVQAEMNAQQIAIFNRFRIVNLAVAVALTAVSAALLVGSIRAMKLQERGRRMLRAACGAAIVFELCRAVPQGLMQLEVMALMEDYLPRLMEASAPGAQGQQIAAFGEMMARFSIIMQWVVFFGWLILKLVYFGLSFHYLGRPKTKTLFAKSA